MVRPIKSSERDIKDLGYRLGDESCGTQHFVEKECVFNSRGKVGVDND